METDAVKTYAIRDIRGCEKCANVLSVEIVRYRRTIALRIAAKTPMSAVVYLEAEDGSVPTSVSWPPALLPVWKAP